MPDIDPLRYREEIQMGKARWGSVAVVCGEVLLWMDLILLSFVYSSIQDGSWFWVWWVLSQGALGVILVGAGAWYRRHHVSRITATRLHPPENSRGKLEEAAMADAEEKREAGASLMFAGLAVWVAGLLVLFFLPAAVRIGQQGRFAAILVGLGVIGAALMLRGWWMRRGSSE